MRTTTRFATFVAATVAVAALAACGDDDSAGDDLPAVDAETSPRMEVSATEMSFTPDAIAVDAGDVEVVLHNEGSVLHDLHIGEEPFIVEAEAGQTATGDISLDPGRYQFYCSLPGHRDAGMEGVLEVR
jgi:uncharacterized cupredoxin-like copper-binding protein